VLIRVTDPERLIDLILFLRNSGFPLVRREADETAEVPFGDEEKLRAALITWEGISGLRAELIDD
jgi:hypothetical protein